MVRIFILLIFLAFLTYNCSNPDPGDPFPSVFGHYGVDSKYKTGERGDIFITEIFWSGSIRSNSDGSVSYFWDDYMIELQNKLERPMNYSRWLLVFEGDMEKTFVIPENDITIYPNDYFVIARTNELAFTGADVVIPDLYIPQENFEITLLDCDWRLIEPAGSKEGRPFAGGNDLITSRSMERSQQVFGNSGGAESNWHSFSSTSGINVNVDFMKKTLASPKHANSKNYAGSTASGDND
jgi:hypothetical protein